MKIFKKKRILRVHIRGDKKGKYCKKKIGNNNSDDIHEICKYFCKYLQNIPSGETIKLIAESP